MRYFLALWLFAASNAFSAAQPFSRLSRTELMQFIDSNGNVEVVKSAADWERRRAAILLEVQKVTGPLPGPEKRSPLEIQVDEEVDCGDHIRRHLSYQSEPGCRTPAYLLIPKQVLASAKATPVVLCLHPTNQELGNKVIVGLGGDPSRAYAVELVQRGFVTLAPAYPHLANYAPELETLGYASGTMKAIWDNIRALDLLETLPFVKSGGFGVIGHSLGGHNAIFTAVFEPRIRVVVSSCGFDSFLDYYRANPGVWQPGKGWTQDRYMPRLANYAGRLEEIPFDFFEVIAALAPRHVLVSAPSGDTNFQWRSVAQIGEAARPVFSLLDAGDRLQIVHPECGHEFPDEIWQRAYRLLEDQLRN